MATGTFMVHAGGEIVDKVAVKRVTTPTATESWCPIAHDRLIDLVQGAMQNMGIAIAREQYALAKDGNLFFGLFDLKGDQPDYDLVFGLRNSHNKMFPAALSLGSRCFVCDNLAFSGEVQIARKHTRHIERDLPALVAKATAALVSSRQIEHTRIATYKTVNFDDKSAHDLIIRAAQMNYFPASDIIPVVNEWHKPRHEEFAPRTGWSLINAFTEIGKSWGKSLPQRTQRLYGLFDAACGVTSKLTALRQENNADTEITVNVN